MNRDAFDIYSYTAKFTLLTNKKMVILAHSGIIVFLFV
ncbi:hypothetical protein bcere0029_26100 [Bacillus cereus AH1272]|nr:hypothetical protein bcere0029_26100 [Bacillus cereus AH1272]EEL93323.1 hypothetical protein bcere0030_26410 [Bacillus cereus AH1273]OSX98484.1 hypothetical protein BTJ45_04500 [Bacillus mycoides]